MCKPKLSALPDLQPAAAQLSHSQVPVQGTDFTNLTSSWIYDLHSAVTNTTLQPYLGPICRNKSAYLGKALHLQKAFQTVTN